MIRPSDWRWEASAAGVGGLAEAEVTASPRSGPSSRREVGWTTPRSMRGSRSSSRRSTSCGGAGPVATPKRSVSDRPRWWNVTSRNRDPSGRPPPFSGVTAWSRGVRTPLREFLRTETGGAAVLLAAAVAALAWVNVHASSYESLWGTTLTIRLGGAGVSLSLREWVNSGQPVVRALLREFGDVAYVWRHLPLTDVQPDAQLAAEAAEAAADQGAFWEMHDLLLDHQDALGPDDLLGYAERLGLDLDRFTTALREHAGAPRVAEDIDSADLSGVAGTPTFFINGRRHYGAYDIATLSAAVRAAGVRAALTTPTAD
jgi:hypothetical protein